MGSQRAESFPQPATPTEGRPKFSLSMWQGLQILLMSRVSVTSASQILESFWNTWSQVSDFPARGPSMYTLS